MAITYPTTLDTVIGTGTTATALSAGGPAGESHLAAHADISAAIVALEAYTATNDILAIQEHFEIGTVTSTLVTNTAYGPNAVYPTFSGTGCAITRAASAAGHKGLWTLLTGTVAANKAEVSPLPGFKDLATGLFGKVAFRAVIQTPGTLPSGSTTTNASFRIGLTDTLSSITPVNGIEWVFNPANSAVWQLVLTKASTATATSSGVTVATSTWYDLQIYIDSNGVQARVAAFDATVLPTLLTGGPFTTNQPLTTTKMIWHVLTANGASGVTSFGINLDLVEWAAQTSPTGISSNFRGAAMVKGF